MSKRLRSEGDHAEAAHVPSLVDRCYTTLTSGDCDWQQLEDLPQCMLLSLLKRCAEERDELKLRCKELEAKEAQRFYVDPPFCCPRLDRLDLGPYPHAASAEEQEQYQTAVRANQAAITSRIQGITSKWRTQSPDDDDFNEPVQNIEYPSALSYSLKDHGFTLVNSLDRAAFHPDRSLYRVISSALLLYRLCCLFEIDVDTAHHTDRYKCVWTANLWHAATGRLVVFDEHKASAKAWVRWPAQEDKQLTRDYLELMDLICGDCPHTYDYVLAGSVA